VEFPHPALRRPAKPLVRLDDRDVQEQLRAAEAQRLQAETEFNRTRTLMATGAATEQALTAARTAFDALRVV
jgi:multidrug efflux pump subunit AcrA (membrane-fusion protein)